VPSAPSPPASRFAAHVCHASGEPHTGPARGRSFASAQRAQDTAQHGLVDGATKPQLGASDLDLDDAWTRASVDGRAGRAPLVGRSMARPVSGSRHTGSNVGGGRADAAIAPDVLTSPLEQKVGIDAAPHRDPPRPTRRGPDSARSASSLNARSCCRRRRVNPLVRSFMVCTISVWCTPSSGWALHQIRCCRAANAGAMTYWSDYYASPLAPRPSPPTW